MNIIFHSVCGLHTFTSTNIATVTLLKCLYIDILNTDMNECLSVILLNSVCVPAVLKRQNTERQVYQD